MDPEKTVTISLPRPLGLYVKRGGGARREEVQRRHLEQGRGRLVAGKTSVQNSGQNLTAISKKFSYKTEAEKPGNCLQKFPLLVRLPRLPSASSPFGV